jgi:predicted nucleic acid-binding protein
MKLFVDSDVILDLLAQRDEFYIYSAKLFSLADENKVKLYTSSIVFANLHYLLKKMTNNQTALKSLRRLKALTGILSIDEKIIEQALNSDFNDFEDAVQYFTAVTSRMNIIITRNKSDYKKSKITVSTAEEFIKAWESKNV